MKTITVYVPCFNSAATLAAVVASIRAQTYPVTEIVTVEDGGNPEPWRLAKDMGLTVLRDHGNENRGLAASCNTALAHCDTEFLAKVDSDVELSPFWFERAMKHFDRPKVMGVGGCLVESGYDLPGRWHQRFMAQNWGAKRKSPHLLFGADCVFRVSALKEMSGWNARYRKNFEDCDLCGRICQVLGQDALMYEPEAMCRHLRPAGCPECLTHSWQWTHDYNDRGYGSIAESAQYISHWHQLGLAACDLCLQNVEPGLIYPCWLSFWWKCICDLEHVRRINPDLSLSVKRTIADLKTDIFHQANRMEALPPLVLTQIRKDMDLQPTPGVSPDTTYMSEFSRHVMPCDDLMAWCLETSVKALNGCWQ